MQWDDLRLFVILADAGSLSAAARRLRLDHTTVARRVAGLEDALGLRLFDRLPRGWSLTAEGERLLDQARRVEEEAAAFARQAQGLGPGAEGIVRISAPPGLAATFLAPHVAGLRRTQPGIVIELVGAVQAASLSRREADIAIRLRAPSDAAIIARRVGSLAYGLYATPGYLRGTAEERWEFLAYDDELAHVPQQRWLLDLAGGRPVVFRSNDVMSQHSACAAGVGLAALPRFLGDSDPRLQALAVPPPAPRELWLLVHPDLRRSPRVRAALDFLADLFRREARHLDPEPPAPGAVISAT